MSRFIRRKDRLGIPYEQDGKIFVDAVAHAALTKGQPYAVHPAACGAAIADINAASGDVVAGQTAAPATLAVYHYVGAPQRAYAQYEIAQIQVGGEGELLVDGTTDVAKADYLEVINGGTSAVKDGTSRTVNAIAMASEAQATNSAVLIDVVFLGVPIQVAAS
jgi:hypothetical protein